MYAPLKVPLNVPNLNRLLLGNYRLLLGDPDNLLPVHSEVQEKTGYSWELWSPTGLSSGQKIFISPGVAGDVLQTPM